MNIANSSSNKSILNPIVNSTFRLRIEVVLFAIFIAVKSLTFNRLIGLTLNPPLFYACVGTAVVVSAILVIFGRKVGYAFLLISDIVLSFIMFADMVYYRYYNDVLSIPVLVQAKLIDPALKTSIFNLIKADDFAFFVDIFILAAVGIFVFKSNSPKKSFLIKQRIIVSLVMLVVGTGMTIPGFYYVNKAMGFKALANVYDHGLFLSNMGVLNLHAFDMYYYISDKWIGKNKLTPDEKEKIKADIGKITVKNSAGKLYGATRGKNLIVIQVEAMENLVINMKIDGREVTPNLNKFLKKSIYFDNYYTQVGQGNTADAEFISNNSFFPLKEGAVYFRCVDNKFNSLPDLFKEQGYETLAAHAYKASFWNRATMYPMLGFDRFLSKKDFKLDECVGWWGLTDRSFLSQTAEKLSEYKKPFYSFIVTLSSHYPYETFANGELGKDFDTGSYNNTFFGSYLKAMHYVDGAIGEFLDKLSKNGLLDKSVVVIYGDHEGVKKGDLNGIKESLKLNTDDELAYLQMKEVPLIIHIPGDLNPQQISTTGGQIDLMPTLANLFGINLSYYMGQDLINADRGMAVFRDGSVTDGRTLYMNSTGECVDMESGKKVNKVDFESYIDAAGNKLRLSDAVMENNLLK
jgi:lipoteichoic acid synthase